MTYILLTGYPPFSGDSDAEIFRSVRRGLTDANFPEDDWAGISTAARAFVTGLLDPDPAKRPTAAAARRDPWVLAGGAEAPAPCGVAGRKLAARLRKYVGLNRLRKTALNVLAHHLTESEVLAMSRVWAQLDGDKTGTLTVKQLFEALKGAGHDAPEAEVAAYARPRGVRWSWLCYILREDGSNATKIIENGPRRARSAAGTSKPWT